MQVAGTASWSDGATISGATVSLSDVSTCSHLIGTDTTDVDGHYELSSEAGQEWFQISSSASADRPGFRLCGPIDASADRTSDHLVIPIRHTTIHVTGAAGAAVQGATFVYGDSTVTYGVATFGVITLFGGDHAVGTMYLPTTPPAPTDARGITTVTSLPTLSAVYGNVFANDGSLGSTEQTLPPSYDDNDVTFAIPTSPVHVSGTASWSDGTIMSGATVALSDVSTCAHLTATDTTDGDGRYELTGISGVQWFRIELPATADRPGFRLCGPIDTTYDRTDDHPVIPIRHSTIHVTGATGAAVRGATFVYGDSIVANGVSTFGYISLFGINQAVGTTYLPTTPAAPTDAGGTTTVTSLPTLSAIWGNVFANDGSVGSTEERIPPSYDDNDVTFAIPSSPVHVSGTATWSDGTLISGADVALSDVATCSHLIGTDITDADGHYDLTGKSGLQWFRVSLATSADRPGFTLCGPIDTTYDRTDDHLVIPIRHTAVHVTGTTGDPVQGATFEYVASVLSRGVGTFQAINLFGGEQATGTFFMPTTPPAPTDTTGTTTVTSLPTLSAIYGNVFANDGSIGSTEHDVPPSDTDNEVTFAIPTSPVHVSGSVVWSDGAPVAGATMTIAGDNCAGPVLDTEVTDGVGHYSLTGTSGPHGVTISLPATADRPGFRLCGSLDATFDRVDDVTTIPIRHTTVHVTSTAGDPVQGATLVFDPQLATRGLSTSNQIPMFAGQRGFGTVFLPTSPPAPTDADGATSVISMPIVNPAYPRVDANDGSAPTTELLFPGGDGDNDVTFAIGVLAGTMRDADGVSLPDQTISMTNPGKPKDSTSTDTDENGDFGITTNPGVFDIGLGGEVGDPTTYKVKVRGVAVRGAVSATRLVLPTQNVRLHVVDAKGAAVPGAKIAMACTTTSFPLLGQTAKGTQCATETVDANGNAVLTVLPTATVKLTITPPAGSFVTPTTVQFTPSDGLGKTITLPSLPKPTLSLTPSTAGPYVTGQRITYTVTATPPTGGSTPGGSVTIAVDGVNAATKALRTGTATVPVTLPGAGTHTITARYSGSSPTYAPATTSSTVKIGKAATTTTLTSTPTAPVASQPVTVTAVVTPTAPGTGTPTGQARFTVDGVVQPASALTAGRAVVTLPGLDPGSHTVAVTYLGSNDHTKSTATTTITVGAAATRTTITSNHPTSTTGQRVTFRITVASLNTNAGTPTGSVILAVDGVDQPALTLTDGTATLTTASLTTGTHQITARYTADSTHATSTSTAVTQTVAGATAG